MDRILKQNFFMVVFGISFQDFKLGLFWGKPAQAEQKQVAAQPPQVFNVYNTTIQNTQINQQGQDSGERRVQGFDYDTSQTPAVARNYIGALERRVYSADHQVYFDPQQLALPPTHPHDGGAGQYQAPAVRHAPPAQPAEDPDDGLTPIQRAWKYVSSPEWGNIVGFDPSSGVGQSPAPAPAAFAEPEMVSGVSSAVALMAAPAPSGNPLVVEGEHAVVDVQRSRRSEMAMAVAPEVEIAYDGRFVHAEEAAAVPQPMEEPAQARSWLSSAPFEKIQRFLSDFYNRDVRPAFNYVLNMIA